MEMVMVVEANFTEMVVIFHPAKMVLVVHLAEMVVAAHPAEMVVVDHLEEMVVVALDIGLEHLVWLLAQFTIQLLITFLVDMTITDRKG